MLTSIFIYKITNSYFVSLLHIPGFFYLFFRLKPMGHLGGTPWAYANGMETGVTLFLFGIFLYLISGVRIHKILISFLLGVLILARLDTVWLTFACVLVFLFSEADFQNKIKSSIAISFLPALALLAYFIFTYTSFGSWLPISYLRKTDPLLIFDGDNINVFWRYISSILGISEWKDFVVFKRGYYWRVLYLLFPVAVCTISLLVIFSRKTLKDHFSGKFQADNNRIFVALLLFPILKCVHIFISYPTLLFIGDWYLPITLLITGIPFCYAIAQLLKISFSKNHLFKYVDVILAISCFIFMLFYFMPIATKNLSKENRYYTFWNDRAKYQRFFDQHDIKKIIEVDDGIINFSLDVSAVNYFGFTWDYDSFLANKEGKLWDHFYDLGYRHLASYHYARGRVPLNPTRNDINSMLYLNPLPDNFTYKILKQYSDSRFLLLELTRNSD